jgi:signal transduction histidine kinase
MCAPSLNDKDKQVLNRINDACQQMEQTVVTLLILAREEHTQSTKEETRLMPIVETSVLDNHYILANKPVEIVIDDTCNANIVCQPGMLKVLIDNLISNACQYTDKGTVNVFFKDNQIIVKDTGPGIDASISNKITEPAIKGSQSTGFGFGLSIVKRLCDNQGWELAVTNDQGTRVSVTLS